MKTTNVLENSDAYYTVTGSGKIFLNNLNIYDKFVLLRDSLTQVSGILFEFFKNSQHRKVSKNIETALLNFKTYDGEIKVTRTTDENLMIKNSCSDFLLLEIKCAVVYVIDKHKYSGRNNFRYTYLVINEQKDLFLIEIWFHQKNIKKQTRPRHKPAQRIETVSKFSIIKFLDTKTEKNIQEKILGFLKKNPEIFKKIMELLIFCTESEMRRVEEKFKNPKKFLTTMEKISF